jgi:hypothetical protein
MFAKSVLFSSLLALAMSKPIARRNSHISISNGVPVIVHGGSFDLSSTTVTQVKTSNVFAFNGFGGLASLNGFDEFFGVNNFCGVQNVIVQENVVTCQVTQVNVVQQQLAIIAEYAKQVILTQSCESEAQVLLFSQWLGGLVNFGQDLRHVNGRLPTYDSHIASQIVNVVDVTGHINVAGFDFAGSNIGSHGVTVINNNWVQDVSPSTVGFVWESAVHAAGSIPLGVSCTSQVCVAPVIQTIETIHTQVEIPSVHTIVNTIVELPHATIAEVPVHTTIVEIPSVHTPVVVHEPVNTPVIIHETVGSVHDSTIVDGQVSTETFSSEEPTATEPVILSSERTGDDSEESGEEEDTTSSTEATTTDAADASATDATTTDDAAASATDAASTSAPDAAATTSDDAAATTDAPAPQVSVQSSASDILNVSVPAADQTVGTRRRLPAVIARRGWNSHRRL